MSKIFIIDEWLWSDLNGENGREKQKEAFYFLETLFKKCDGIAVAKGSKFQQKGWNFSKNASTDVVKHEIAKLYFSWIRANPEKYKEVDIEEEKNGDLEGINPDDLYLVKTYYKTNGLIITTDNKLWKILKSKNILCELRDEFLRGYNSNLKYSNID